MVAARLTAPLGIVVVLILLQSLLHGEKEVFSFSILGTRFRFMEEGAWQGLLIGSKVLGSVSIMLLFSFVTPAHKIFRALLWCRLPRGWVEIAMMMYRYIFHLIDGAGDVMAAQRARLGYFGLKRSLSSLGSLIGVVIIRSIDQAARTHEAMVLRGYRGTVPFGPMSKMGGRDRWRMVGGLIVLLSSYLLLEGRLRWIAL